MEELIGSVAADM